MSGFKRAVIAGGGAAGFFAALRLAAQSPSTEVIILEQSARVLSKVAISGGGRCNVTHDCTDPRTLCRHYPRGEKELRGAFHRFSPLDTIEWFEERGVRLKTETDGRMFPVTDDSATVVDCLVAEARRLKVEVRLRCGLKDFRAGPEGVGFALNLGRGDFLSTDLLMIATGGLKRGGLTEAIEACGHRIEPLVPSLFTFHINDPRLEDLSGLVAEKAEVSVEGLPLPQKGALLITHWGLSGPAILQLSAWGARELADQDYQFKLNVNWIGKSESQQIATSMARLRSERGRQNVHTHAAFGLPRRLWQRLVASAGIPPESIWSHLPKAAEQALIGQLTQSRFEVTGKSLNKEEFVTCGGVCRKEIDFKTMESRLIKGLYFGGEAIDLDGITGGFNLQAAWTTGFLAGEAMGLV